MRPKWTRYFAMGIACCWPSLWPLRWSCRTWDCEAAMKHCILAKFTPEAKAQRAALLPRIREIFSAAADIPGVHGAEVIPNCVDRDNRYDVLIRLDMDREALPLYDVSAMHHRWKDEFTPLLEKKAIFDHES